ncbi:MAG: BamA/TamA family outer membrane protein [Candidatus Omnitrophica bacterium]|nr:BamA/TamA family outer membrane protein [Candidatus Omnitrophota bacterium]
MRSRELQQKEEKLRDKIETPRKAPEKEELPVLPTVPESAEKTLIKKINVTGATTLSKKEIDKIVLPFENQELNLKQMQEVANLITDLYRQKGYVNSLAYLPPQDIKQGILEIKVVEVALGEVEIKGNRYFKTTLLRGKIPLKKGEPFNYNLLRKGLIEINKQPDRNARAVLAAGKDPGTTDVILEVKDRLPIHVGFSMDNSGSRYIDKYRYAVKFNHNNLLGLDDKLNFQYQLAQASRYFLKSISYLLPVKLGWEVGAAAFFSRVKLGKELKDSDVRGRTKLYSLFVNRSLIDMENFDLGMSLGFDYKDIINYQLGAVTSHDRLRVAKIDLNADISDNFGRTIVTNGVDFGIPDIMGGLAAKDINSSRSGAGGKFIKNTINLLRLQKMPFSSTVLWKNQIQISPYILTAAEQFQIGGIANVRGYPPAEAIGDQGYSMTWEWSFPLYFVPKEIKVPFSKAKLYDAFRLAMFYDWANTRLRRPAASERKNETLRGWGCGARFNLPEDFSFRVDLGWPLDNTPSDGNRLHTWVQVSKDF